MVTSEKESSEEDGLEHVHKNPRVVIDIKVKRSKSGSNAKASVDHICKAKSDVWREAHTKSIKEKERDYALPLQYGVNAVL